MSSTLNEFRARLQMELDRDITHALMYGEIGIKKSRILLLENLSKTQREDFLRFAHFDVKIDDVEDALPSYAGIYRLHRDITVRMGDRTRFCVIFPGLPIHDQLLARKLFLECDPHEFFRVANVFPSEEARWPRTVYGRRGFHETVFDVAQRMLVRIGQGFGLRMADLGLRIDESDLGHVIEFQVLLYGIRPRNFRMDAEHFRQQNWERLLFDLLHEAVAYLCAEYRATQVTTMPQIATRGRPWELDPF